MTAPCQYMRQAFTHVVSASAGAVVSAFVRVPTDTLKHRVQAYVLPDVFRARPDAPPLHVPASLSVMSREQRDTHCLALLNKHSSRHWLPFSNMHHIPQHLFFW